MKIHAQSLYDESDAARGSGGGTAAAEIGAMHTQDGTAFQLWAPQAKSAEVVIFDRPSIVARRVPLFSCGAGWFRGLDAAGSAGDHYKFRLDEKLEIPDPASRWQPEGPHGASVVTDASQFPWQDASWRSPALDQLVIYELHVGTFTPEGTFSAAMAKLPYLKDLGVTAIELMPLAEFAGTRNWGYDGVCLFAPSHAYGTPDDLRALVDEAHWQGLAVILDVVYNHFGPDGNYLGVCVGDYLDEEAKTPWGGAIRYGDPSFAPLRQMLVSNVRYWMRDFHIDGFRLDATHAIFDESPVHILQEVTAAIHAEGRFAIAEDSRNDAKVCEPRGDGGLGFDAVWADDFHHTMRVGQTREAEGYYADYSGAADELFEILSSGWLYQGQPCKSTGTPRGTPCHHLASSAFIACISNHDQTGNRAFGERLHQCVSPAAYRAMSALLCLCPFTPMLFMGQEWAASSPFLFFTDHGRELGALITHGRRHEFAAFPEFRHEEALQRIPDPQAESTFAQSKLLWNEMHETGHLQTLALYRECLRWRKKIPLLNAPGRRGCRLEKLPQDLLAIHYDGEVHGHTLIVHLADEPAIIPVIEICPWLEARLALSSEEARFGAWREALPGLPAHNLHLKGPEVVLVEW